MTIGRVLLLILWPLPANAQPVLLSWLNTLKEHGVAIHKSFEGTKNEKEPASFAFVQPTYIVDLGIKLADWEPVQPANITLVVSPVVEWHRTNTPKNVNTTSGKLKIETAFGHLQLYGEHGKAVDVPGATGRMDSASFANRICRGCSPRHTA